jgi:hypothetical protein
METRSQELALSSHNSNRLSMAEIRQLYNYNAIVEQDQALNNLQLYAIDHAHIDSVADAIIKGENIKPDFSLALNKLGVNNLVKLKIFLEGRARQTSYRSLYTIIKNAGSTAALCSLAFFTPYMLLLVIPKIGYDLNQHEKSVKQRVAWLLSDVDQILNGVHYSSQQGNEYDANMTITPYVPTPYISTVEMPSYQSHQTINNNPFSFFSPVPIDLDPSAPPLLEYGPSIATSANNIKI